MHGDCRKLESWRHIIIIEAVTRIARGTDCMRDTNKFPFLADPRSRDYAKVLSIRIVCANGNDVAHVFQSRNDH